MSIREVLVVGGGAVGLSTALLAARAGLSTTLLRRPGSVPGAEVRTTALLDGSVRLMRHLGAWDAIAPRAAPLRVMRLVDDTGRLVRAPTIAFKADELGLDAFGWNVPNHVLVDALEAVVAAEAALTVVDGVATDVAFDPDTVTVTTDGGATIAARLVGAADGAKSMLREAAGIAARAWHYDQVAVTVNLEHTAPHRDISTELHTPSGPFTMVPLPGRRSSLVAVVRPADADFLQSLPDSALADELERRAHSLLGKFTVASGRGAFPLSGLTPERFAARRVAFIGEAAHVFPPIGAQGLNLGLRDAAHLAEIAAEHRGDPGSDAAGAAYDAARRADVVSRTFAVDALNRTLLSPLLPAQAARGIGLALADMVPPLRRALLADGLQPSRAAPRVMRVGG